MAITYSAFVSVLLVKLCSNFDPNNTISNGFECELKNITVDNNLALKGRTIRMLTFDDPPLSGVTKGSGKKRFEGTGIAFELIRTLQEKYGFNYEVTSVPPVVGDNENGALAKLVSMEADMLVGFIPVIAETHQYVKWGVELFQAPYYVLMKRPDDYNNGSGLLAPFDEAVWILILISLLAVGPIMYGVMWLRMKLCPDEFTQVFPLPSCVWFVYGALMKQGSTLNPVTDSARMLFATWWIFILILTAFYTANLTAFLTLSLPTLPIKEISDVAKGNNKWFAIRGGVVQEAIKGDDIELNVLKKSQAVGKARFIETKSESEISQWLIKGFIPLSNRLLMYFLDWLYLDDWYTVTRLMYNDYKQKVTKEKEESKRCSYVITEKSFLIRSMAFAYQNNSDLPELFDPIIRRFVESGIIKHALGLNLPDATVCPLNLGNKERKLKNTDLLMTYAVVLSGFTCAMAVFFGELLWRWYVGDKRNYPWGSAELAPKRDFKIYPQFRADDLRKDAKNKIGSDYFFIMPKGADKRFAPLRTPSSWIFH